MPDYIVTWTRAVDADNPERAARKAQAALLGRTDSDEAGAVFDVAAAGTADTVSINLSAQYAEDLYQQGGALCPQGHEYDMTETCPWCHTCWEHCNYPDDHKDH